MFTGLVASLGTVEAIHNEGEGTRLVIRAPGLDAGAINADPDPIVLGESVAVNGCCLTAVATDNATGTPRLTFQAGPETLARTNLGRLTAGDAVNLERAARVGDRLGGHFVLGHIDTVAHLATVRTEGDWRFLHFRLDPAWTPLLVPKGSIALDGVSLTLVDVAPDGFSVMLIPHTLAVTTLGRIAPGDCVNVETDILAKHVRKLTLGV